MQNVHELAQDYTLSKLHSLLNDEKCLTDDIVRKVCECVKNSDLFSFCHQGPLRTTYSRAQTFKKMFQYIEPKKVSLGNDENMTQRFAHYIPVIQTLSNLLKLELWKYSVSQISSKTDSDYFGDVSDGKNFKCNHFFRENAKCLKVILYQDAFEIVNPLGSAKKKHKVVAVYLSVVNLPPHVRSNTDLMSLVLLCAENDLKRFGSAKVFSELLVDLQDLEENGITVGSETVKGALYCIAGDNLGSHSIGGFTENFKMTDLERTFLRSAISEVLPDLPEVTKDILEETLHSLGVETYDDFKFIEEDDLLSALRPVQARKVIAAWKLRCQTLETSSSSVGSSPGHPTTLQSFSPSNSQSFSSSSSHSSDIDWVDTFLIPWEKFPEELIQVLEREKRPSPRLRREMVRIVVTEMMRKGSAQNRRHSTEVAKKMVSKYPKSLQDVIDGDVFGPGYHSLVKQLQYRIDTFSLLYCV
ncbi:hypothetical protein Q7C36_010155 [Tachysurus vachellii]|uniref:Uncharacterized protein n=1 Tax=Tachysurus vachellii TaxID=175792 RepID=A0AA88SRK4_TACVA|nr:hypothetical protein Q7C36_010155 [Tachysurus vachellii]